MTHNIIGLTGFAQSGKDSAGGFLAEFGYKRLAFADALRQSVYNLNPVISVARESVREGWGRTQSILAEMGYEEAKRRYPEYRDLLQRFGTEVGRDLYGENFWVNQVISQIERKPDRSEVLSGPMAGMITEGYPRPVGKYVITDVRFPNEAKAVRDLGGVIFRIERPGTGPVNAHISDTGISALPVDMIVPNVDGLEHFRENVLGAAGIRLD